MLKTTFRLTAVVAILVAAAAQVLAADETPQEKAVKARQGFMKLVVWEAGPLFGMAKGAMDYNADAANRHAASLKALSQYPFDSLFLDGTSIDEMSDKTGALKKIWEDMDGFKKALENWRKAVANLEGTVGQGHSELAAAVGALGKACGGCHDNYRKKQN